MGGTGHRPVPSGDSPDGTGTTPCGNECLPTVGAPSSFRPASGRAARAGRPCHPDKCEISGLVRLRPVEVLMEELEGALAVDRVRAVEEFNRGAVADAEP